MSTPPVLGGLSAASLSSIPDRRRHPLVEVLQWLAFANLWLALGVALTTWGIQQLFALGSSCVPACLAFLVFFAIYTVDRCSSQQTGPDAVNHPVRRGFCVRHARALWLSAAVAYASALAVALAVSRWALIPVLLPVAAVTYYSLAPLPRPVARMLKAKRIKDVFALKNAWVAGAIAATILSAASCGAGARLPAGAWLLGAVMFVRLFVNGVVFDMRDESGDRAHGARTLPVVLGRRRTRWILQTANMLAGVILALAPLFAHLPWRAAVLLQSSTLYGLWYVETALTTRDLHAFCDVAVDGEWFLFGATLTASSLLG